MSKVLLIRHGHVEGISPARFRGRTNLPLTARGVAEAQAVAQRVASRWQPLTIYTSPMRRCIETGAAIAKACRIDSQVMDQLNDIDYGAWQWRTYEDVKETDPTRFTEWFTSPQLVRFPNGESLQDLIARSADAFRLILYRHANDTVVLVSHDSVNRALLLQLLEQPLSAYWRVAQDPCCINEIEVVSERIQVLRINETSHVNDLRS